MAPRKILRSKKTSTKKTNTKNKIQAQRLSPHKGISEPVLCRRNSSESSGPKSCTENKTLSSSKKQTKTNNIPFSKNENKKNMENESLQSIEDRVLKMSLEEFQDNTNIVDLLTNHFRSENYSEQVLKQMLFDIDIYVYRTYHKYQRKPSFRKRGILENLKIVDQSERSQNGSHSKKRNRVEVVVKDGKEHYILIVPKPTEKTEKLSHAESNNGGQQVIDLESLDENEIFSGQNLPVPEATGGHLTATSPKLTQSSDEIPCNQEMKRRRREATSSKKQALKQKTTNRPPSPKEGCSKWFYNSPSQKSSQKSIQEFFQNPKISQTSPNKSSEKPGPLSRKNVHFASIASVSSGSSDDSTPNTSSDDDYTPSPEKNRKKNIPPNSKKGKTISEWSKLFESKRINGKSEFSKRRKPEQKTCEGKDEQIAEEANAGKRLRSSANSKVEREIHNASDTNKVSGVSKRRLFSNHNYSPPYSYPMADDREELQETNNTEGKQTLQSEELREVNDNSKSRKTNPGADSKTSESDSRRINVNQDMAPRKILRSKKTSTKKTNTKNKIQSQRHSPQESIAEPVLRRRNSSESSGPKSFTKNSTTLSSSKKQPNSLPFSKNDNKENMENESLQSIEERILKMSLEEFQDNTNIVDLLTNSFRSGNYSEQVLKQMLFDIDIYVYRTYHKYQRKPSFRKRGILENLKIVDQSERSQNGSHSKKRNRVEVVIKDGKEHYILIVPKPAQKSEKLSHAESNNGGQQVIDLDSLDENEIFSGQNLPVPEATGGHLTAVRPKLTQSSGEISSNQKVKRGHRGLSSTESQDLEQMTTNRPPSPQEGCSNWMYNSTLQTLSQKSIQQYFQHLASISTTNPKKSLEISECGQNVKTNDIAKGKPGPLSKKRKHFASEVETQQQNENGKNVKTNDIAKEKPGPLSKKRKHLVSEVETQQQNNQTHNASLEMNKCSESNVPLSISSDSIDDSIVISKKKRKKNISATSKNKKINLKSNKLIRGKHLSGENKLRKKIEESPPNAMNNENNIGSNVEEMKSVNRNGNVLDNESALKRSLLSNSCEKSLNQELRRLEPIQSEIQVEQNQSKQKTSKRKDNGNSKEDSGKQMCAPTDSSVEENGIVILSAYSLSDSKEVSNIFNRRLISNENDSPKHSFTVVDDREEFQGSNNTDGKQTTQSKKTTDINQITSYFLQKYDERARSRDIGKSLIQHRKMVASKANENENVRNELNVKDNHKSSVIPGLVPAEIDELKKRSIDTSDSTSSSDLLVDEDTVIEVISPQIAHIGNINVNVGNEPSCSDIAARVCPSPPKNRTIENTIATNEEVNRAYYELSGYHNDITCPSENKKKNNEIVKPNIAQPKLETNDNFDDDTDSNDSDVIYIERERERVIIIEDNEQSLIDAMQQFGDDSSQSQTLPAVMHTNERIQQFTPLSGDTYLSNAGNNCVVSDSTGDGIQLIEQLDNRNLASIEEIAANDPGVGGSKDANTIDLTTNQLPSEKHLEKNTRSESGRSENSKETCKIQQKSTDDNQFTIKQENIEYSQYADEVQLIPASKKVIVILDGDNNTEDLLHEMCNPGEVDFIEEPMSRSSKLPNEMPTGNSSNAKNSSSTIEPLPSLQSSASSNESSLLNQAQIISSTMILSTAENDKLERSDRQLNNTLIDTSIVPFVNAPRDPGASKIIRYEESNSHKDESRQGCNATSKHIGNSAVQMSKTPPNPVDIAVAPEIVLSNLSQASQNKQNNQSHIARKILRRCLKKFIAGRYRPLQVVQEKNDFGRLSTGLDTGPKATNSRAIESTSASEKEDERDNLIEDASQQNILNNSTFNADAYLEGDTSMFGNISAQLQSISHDNQDATNTQLVSAHNESDVLPTVEKPHNEKSSAETLPLSKLSRPVTLKYSILTYLNIKTIKFWKSVKDLEYACSAPLLESSTDIRAKAIITLPMGRPRTIEIMGNSLQLLLGLTVKEWESVLTLVSAIKKFEYQSANKKPQEGCLPYQILYWLFKSLPRFAQVMLESGPTLDESQAKCVPLSVGLDSLKPTTSLTHTLNPKLLERIKRLKAGSQHGDFSNNSERLDNNETVNELRSPQIVHFENINIENEPSCNDIAAQVCPSPPENRAVENTVVANEEVNRADGEYSGYRNAITYPSDHQSNVNRTGHFSAIMSNQHVAQYSDAEDNIIRGMTEKSKNLQQTSMNVEVKQKNAETVKPDKVQQRLETNENLNDDTYYNDSDVIYIGNESESVIIIEDNEQSLVDAMQQFGDDSSQSQTFPAVMHTNERLQQFTPLSGDTYLSNADNNCVVSVSSGDSIQFIEQLDNRSPSSTEEIATNDGVGGSKNTDVIDLTTYQLPSEKHLKENTRSESARSENSKETCNIQYADEVQLIPASNNVIVILDGGNNTEDLLDEMCNPGEVDFIEEPVSRSSKLPNEMSTGNSSNAKNSSSAAEPLSSTQSIASSNERGLLNQVQIISSAMKRSTPESDKLERSFANASRDPGSSKLTRYEESNSHKDESRQGCNATSKHIGNRAVQMSKTPSNPVNIAVAAKITSLSKLYRPVHVWKYSTLTDLDIKTIKFWKHVQDLHYDCRTPFLERPTDTRAKATIKFLRGRRCIIEVMGNSLELLLGVTIKEWECVLKLVSTIEHFEEFQNESLNKKPKEEIRTYQVLHNLFKSLPRFGEVILECGSTPVENQAYHVSMGVKYMKPIKSLTRALYPKHLKQLKQLKASSQRVDFCNE